MLTYQEYYTRMQSVAMFFNNSVSHAQLNIQGMNEQEAVQYQIGRYIQALASSTMPSFFVQKCAFAIDLLTGIMQSYSARFDFSMFEPSEVEQDDEFMEGWKKEFIRYTRMSPASLVGEASMSGTDCCLADGGFDIVGWCVCQAYLLASYCVAHDIDVTHAISII